MVSRLYRNRGAKRSVRRPHPPLRGTFPRGEGYWSPFTLLLLTPCSKLTVLPFQGRLSTCAALPQKPPLKGEVLPPQVGAEGLFITTLRCYCSLQISEMGPTCPR